MKRRVNRKLRSLAVATGLLLFTAASSLAGSVTEPGETIGLPNGTPAPPGFFLANEANYGCRDTSPQHTCALVDVPLLAWATPWTIFGGRLTFAASPAPSSSVSILNTTAFAGLFNPFVSGIVAWDLGHDWGFSYMLGAYIEVNSPVTYSSSSLNQRFALSYSGNGWDLTANVIWGVQFDQVTSKPEGFPCPVSVEFPHNGCNPNFINLDLTATKKFGKWELGPVGFYSTDLSAPAPGYQKQSQFAVGGLIGYWFDRAVVQAYVTSDVYQKNYRGYETRGWFRIVIPLGNPTGGLPPPAIPLAQ